MTKPKFLTKMRIIDSKRKENRVSLDSMLCIAACTCDVAFFELLKEREEMGWEKTKFIFSTRSIGEVKGKLIHKYGFTVDNANKVIDERLKNGFNAIFAKFDDYIDRKGATYLIGMYRQQFGSDPHEPDAEIVAHLNRERVNIFYSNEEAVRKMAELLGMEARSMPLTNGDIPRQIFSRLFPRHR